MTDLPGSRNVPDLTDQYNLYLYTASNRKFADSLTFHRNLVTVLNLLAELLEKYDSEQGEFTQVGLIDECLKNIEIYDKTIKLYRNTSLKALIIHDLKGAMNNMNMALKVLAATHYKEAKFVAEKLRIMSCFINLISITLFPPSNWNGWIHDDEIVAMLIDTIDGGIQLEFNASNYCLHRFREMIWPIHTVLLNAKEKGAQKVFLRIIEDEEQLSVEISDDIADYNGATGDDLINNINENINMAPRTIYGAELFAWEAIDGVAEVLAEMFVREGDTLDHFQNVIVPLISADIRKMLENLKDDLPEHFANAIAKRKAGDTDQLSGQKGLSITKVFLKMFNGTVTCVPYNPNIPLKTSNRNNYVKTIRLSIPNNSQEE